MHRVVIRAHRSSYPDPIAFKADDLVTLGRTDPEYPAWIRTRLADGNEGWAPRELLDPRPDGTSIVTADYDARELDTLPGQVLEIRRELHGWAWARNDDGAEGWVPLDTTAPPN